VPKPRKKPGSRSGSSEAIFAVAGLFERIGDPMCDVVSLRKLRKTTPPFSVLIRPASLHRHGLRRSVVRSDYADDAGDANIDRISAALKTVQLRETGQATRTWKTDNDESGSFLSDGYHQRPYIFSAAAIPSESLLPDETLQVLRLTNNLPALAFFIQGNDGDFDLR